MKMFSWMYRGRFYSKRRERTEYAARTILNLVNETLSEQEKINRVADFGCGVGVFLDAAERIWNAETVGFEGGWVPRELFIPNGILKQGDIISKANSMADLSFDLCICLEVAEHFPAEKSEALVDALCRLAPVVLFGAAPVGQGGKGHVNEAPLSYWASAFEKRGYNCFDKIRPNIWNDKAIPFWYRQNTVLFMKRDKEESGLPPLDAIHPELFHLYRYPRLYIALQNLVGLPAALFRTLKQRFEKK